MCAKWIVSFLTIVLIAISLIIFPSCTTKRETAHRQALFKNSQAIIIDHTCTDVSKIPDYWLNKAKELTIYYAHTSHGKQLVQGAEFLATQDPKYSFRATYTNNSNPTLPDSKDAIRMYHTLGFPTTYWKSYYKEGGDTRKAADTKLFNFSMFSWCGQQSSNSVETVNLYLQALDGYEKEYPHMRFIYMTGHTDGGRRSSLRRNNEMIRKYCAQNNKVLYDFADIESWSPDGKYDSFADQDCDWCPSWCNKNPGDCIELPKGCAHSPNKDGDIKRSFNCVLKGKAFWWMMARLAGWNPKGGELN